MVTRFWLSATSIKMNNIKHALMGRKNVMFVGLSISEILVGNTLSDTGILGYQSFEQSQSPRQMTLRLSEQKTVEDYHQINIFLHHHQHSDLHKANPHHVSVA